MKTDDGAESKDAATRTGPAACSGFASCLFEQG